MRRFVATHGPVVSIADDAAAFSAALRAALAADTQVQAAHRLAIATRHDRATRITAMSDLMEAPLAARRDEFDGALAVVS